MKLKVTAMTFLISMSMANGFAQGITYKSDTTTGAISELSINNDAHQMNWVLSPDGKQYKWVTSQYGWGLGFLTVNGEKLSWQKPTNQKKSTSPQSKTGKKGGITHLSYQAGNVRIIVTRQLVNGELFEEYTFKNVGKTAAHISDCGIYTPWNDNYPDAATCMTNRCNAHIWAGDNAAYAMAIRMGANGGNVGLMLIKGSIPDYEEWERKRENANSNFRGVFAMALPDMNLAAGKSYSIAWKIFEHKGKKDFMSKLLAQGGAIAKSKQYVYQQGEIVKVYLKKDKIKSLSATVTSKNMKNGDITSAAKAIKTGKDAEGYYAYFTAKELGEQRIDLYI